MVYKQYNWMDIYRTKSAVVQEDTLRETREDVGGGRRVNRASVLRNARRVLLGVQSGELLTDTDQEAFMNELETTHGAANYLVDLMRGTRVRKNQSILSYLDGTPHESCEIDEYNAYCRPQAEEALQQALDDGKEGWVLPSEKEHHRAIRKIRKLVSKAYDLHEERHNNPDEFDQQDELDEIEAELEQLLDEYNEKALACAQELEKHSAHRNAGIGEGFQPST